MLTLNRKFARKQSGQILILALIFLAVGGLIIPPLLGLIGTSLKAEGQVETSLNRYYVADAGVEYALLTLRTSSLAEVGSSLPDYALNVDGKITTVSVSLFARDDAQNLKTYRVQSITDIINGSTSKIVSYVNVVKTADYSYYLDNVITTEGTFGCKNGVEINGFAQSGEIDFKGGGPDWGTGYGMKPGKPVVWPTSSELQQYYLVECPVGSPNYHATDWAPSGVVNLNGTVYINGAFNPAKNTVINLHGHTIFATAGMNFLKDVTINSRTDLMDPALGALVTTGSILTKPNINIGTNSQPMLVMALGSISYWPSNNFVGWIAGKAGVDMKNGSGPEYNWAPWKDADGNPLYDLDFPGLDPSDPSFGVVEITVASWDLDS